MPWQQKPIKWAAFYGATAPLEDFEPYELLIFDADHHPNLAPLQAQGKRILAYMAISEIAPYRSYAAYFLSKSGFVVGQQQRWNSAIIDLRDKEWQAYVLETYIPHILAQGFDGVFIDTLDASLDIYKQDPIRFSGTYQAAIDMVKSIRSSLPHGYWIMVNRAFEILPDIVPGINAVLAESILVDARSSKTQFFPDAVYLQHVRQLQRLRQEKPALRLFSLDYLSDRDIDTVSTIACTQRKHGFSPYVATPNLQEIMPALPCT